VCEDKEARNESEECGLKVGRIKRRASLDLRGETDQEKLCKLFYY